MSTTVPIKTARTLIAAGTVNAAVGTTRATLDMRGVHGGLLTLKILNGATGPTVQAVCNILVAHNGGDTPAPASEGADWKTIWSFGGQTTANLATPQSLVIDAAVMHLEVEFTGNTVQPVTCEAYLSELTSFSTTA